MAWNQSSNKSLNNASGKSLGPGMPVANNPSFVGKPYRDNWDIERAYKEGMQKVTWVNRCVDAIAGNQARLPVMLRKDNSPDGEIVTGREAKRSNILEILNTKANMGENSFIFRYRLSAQLLLGTRGVFIEKIRGRDGGVIALSLLPPQHTAPIPHPKTFVSGYEVAMPNGDKIILPPRDVVWVRRPHPLDPYLSLTPLESCGIAIEIENLAKIYNRNYLLNDGRPGGLLVVRGEMEEPDKEELRNRFRGNISRTGHTTVIASDDGVDYIDTSASPRDAAYVQMRQLTKEEILASFGVPESVIGNASGRTFSNAAEEIRVFWMETMLPHLEPLARALDELDDENYIDFDLTEVPILMLYKQERERYLLQEFQTGLISNNEYRLGSGRKETDADLADSLLMNPNLIPIANTKKKMDVVPTAEMGGVPPGAPPEAPPGLPPEAPVDPNTMQGALAAEGAPPAGDLAQALPGDAAPANTAAPIPAGATSAQTGGIMHKSDTFAKETTAIGRWEEILARSLERVVERQQRVVLEKISGAKSKKSLFAGTLDAEYILNSDLWNRQMDEDIRPVISAIIQESMNLSAESTETKTAEDGISTKAQEDIRVQVDSQMDRIKQLNTSNQSAISNMMLNSFNIFDLEERASAFKSSVNGLYVGILSQQQQDVSEEETRRAWAFGKGNL